MRTQKIRFQNHFQTTLLQSHCKVQIEGILMALVHPIWCDMFPNVEGQVLNLASPCQEAYFQHDPSSSTCDVSSELLHALHDTTTVMQQILSLCSRDTAFLDYLHTIAVGPCLEYDQDVTVIPVIGDPMSCFLQGPSSCILSDDR